MVRVTGIANPSPGGPRTTAVPLTSRGSAGRPVAGSMKMLVFWKSAPAGTIRTTLPFKPSTVPPAGVTGPPSRTTTVALPLFPPLVAVIVVTPAARPNTSPRLETVAIVLLLEVHEIAAPVTGFPEASLSWAGRGTEPAGTVVSTAGVTATDATGALGPVPPPSIRLVPLVMHAVRSSTNPAGAPQGRRRTFGWACGTRRICDAAGGAAAPH